jgi:hypothetical protein
MEKRYEIGSELREISPHLAGIPRGEGPYIVPEGYFDSFADRMMNKIREGSKISVMEELKEISPLLLEQAAAKTTSQQVPDGFFEEFPGLIMRRIRAMESDTAGEELQLLSPLLSGMEKKTPFELPDSYFNELSGNLVAGMQAVDFVKDELEDLPASLVNLKESNPYEVPTGYFETLPERVLGLVRRPAQPARVVSMGQKRVWIKYAAAAVVTGLIFTAGLLYFHRPASHGGEDPVAGLSKVSDQEILNYLQNEDIPLMSSSPLGSSSALANIEEFSDSDIKEQMGDVSDNELQQYENDHLLPRDETTN